MILSPKKAVPKAITIAGSDSGAGAGIQADLKTFAALEVYASTIITAVTAQNTLGVTAVHTLPAEMVTAQLDAVMEDIGADAVKIGMLSEAGVIEAVAAGLVRHRLDKVVLDPVMMAKSGHRLLVEEAVAALIHFLLPLAYVVTPNLPEAEVLAGIKIEGMKDRIKAAEIIHKAGAKYVVIKGGHDRHQPQDILFDGKVVRELETSWVDTPNTHGTGCTFSSAIAAGLAKGLSVPEAVAQAKDYLTGALRCSYAVGAGHSPVNHFFRWWPEEGRA
ncbi:MAG TPA: bifunctional hydroxymethylpyrimidine kinase/phosphomethylpyrimidine kinase [Firmicutes bacterium]|nr:bifunctional hydroxymethylpyrimidine kinase/phosphomethylpyrimidine kinase [Bacillota bacterium]